MCVRLVYFGTFFFVVFFVFFGFLSFFKEDGHKRQGCMTSVMSWVRSRKAAGSITQVEGGAGRINGSPIPPAPGTGHDRDGKL